MAGDWQTSQSRAKPKDQSRSQEPRQKQSQRSSQSAQGKSRSSRGRSGKCQVVWGAERALFAGLHNRVDFGFGPGFSSPGVGHNKSSRWRTSGGCVCPGDIDLMERQTMRGVQVGLSGVSAVFAWSKSRSRNRMKKADGGRGSSCEIQSKTRQQDRTGQVESRSGQD